jgi:hypothetical protein
LGRAPLLPLEATNSWPAWLWAQAMAAPDGVTPVTALFFSLQSALFWLTAGSDLSARLVPASIGTALVLLPWWWRPWLGPWGALALAALVALDPWLVMVSRLADGAGLSVACAFLALTALMRLALAGRERLNRETSDQPIADDARPWSTVAGIAGGLLVVSGPLAWSFLPLLVLFAVLYARELSASGLLASSWLRWAVAAALLGGTGWLARPQGLAMVSASLTVWLEQWQASGYGAWWPYVRLVADQPLLLIVGMIGLVTALPMALQREGDGRWERFLWLWLIWGVALLALPGRNPLSLAVVVWPLIFGAVHMSRLLVGWGPEGSPAQPEWRELRIVAATLVILFVSGVFWATALVASRSFEPVMAQAVGAIGLLAVLVLILYGWWSGWEPTRWVVCAGIAVMLLVTTTARAWELNVEHDWMHPEGLFAVTTHPEMRLLAADMETMSAHRTGDPHQMAVEVLLRGQPPRAIGGMELPQKVVADADPVVGWYLRAMKNLSWWSEAGRQAAGETPFALELGDAEAQLPAGLNGSYARSSYGWRASWLPETLWTETVQTTEPGSGLAARLSAHWSARWQPALRWLIYRRAPTTPEMQPTIQAGTLWVPVEQ